MDVEIKLNSSGQGVQYFLTMSTDPSKTMVGCVGHPDKDNPDNTIPLAISHVALCLQSYLTTIDIEGPPSNPYFPNAPSVVVK